MMLGVYVLAFAEFICNVCDINRQCLIFLKYQDHRYVFTDIRLYTQIYEKCLYTEHYKLHLSDFLKMNFGVYFAVFWRKR